MFALYQNLVMIFSFPCVSGDAGNPVIQHSTLPLPSQGPLSCHTHLPATLGVASAPFLPFQYLVISLYLSFLSLSHLGNRRKLCVILLHYSVLSQTWRKVFLYINTYTCSCAKPHSKIWKVARYFPIV